MTTTVLVTYDELASARGIKRDSARSLVGENKWFKQKGDDGVTRIAVPREMLAPKQIGLDTADDVRRVAKLEADNGWKDTVIDLLRVQLDDMRKDRDHWRELTRREPA